ncbi:unnamed protein product [Lathyrus sativus]|nr:unnamed protein product [Lathyrus sativus]
MKLANKRQRRVERSSNLRGLAPFYQVYIAITKIKQEEGEIECHQPTRQRWPQNAWNEMELMEAQRKPEELRTRAGIHT